MEKTKFLGLNKPGYEHLADIAVLNENFQKIDDDASKRQKELEDHKIKKVSASEDGHMTKEDKKKIDGIATGANNYALPVATESVLGGVKSDGNTTQISGLGIISLKDAWRLRRRPIGNSSTVTDMDTIFEKGFYESSSSGNKWTNGPLSDGAFFLEVKGIGGDATYGTQTWYSITQNRIFHRVNTTYAPNPPKWTAWSELALQSNVNDGLNKKADIKGANFTGMVGVPYNVGINLNSTNAGVGWHIAELSTNGYIEFKKTQAGSIVGTMASITPEGYINATRFNGYITDNHRAYNEDIANDHSTVGKYLRWENFGKNHVIFDASKGISPSGATIDNKNAKAIWTPSYPSLMGWNGSQTYGLRVDSCRIADTAVDNSHNHTIANVTGLQAQLDAKLLKTGGNITGAINSCGANSKISSKGTANSYSNASRSNTGFHVGDGYGNPLTIIQGTSNYIKGYQIETVTAGLGYVARSNIGHLRSGAADFGKTLIYFEGDNAGQMAKYWQFNHTTGALELQGGTASVITGSSNGATGYRIHADGFKEAWGTVSLVADETDRTITLPFSFATTNYNISSNTAATAYGHDNVINIWRGSVNTIRYRNNFVGTNGTGTGYWHVGGY